MPEEYITLNQLRDFCIQNHMRVGADRLKKTAEDLELPAHGFEPCTGNITYSRMHAASILVELGISYEIIMKLIS